MEWGTIWISLGTSVIGGLTTGFLFYYCAGKQLSKEAKRLDLLSTMILKAMEQSGQVQLKRDASGEVIGLVFGKALIAGMSSMSGNLSVEKNSAPQTDIRRADR
jgi:hypothetical protein